MGGTFLGTAKMSPLIETYERHLGELKRLIAAGDAAGIEKQLDKAGRAGPAHLKTPRRT